MMLELTFIAPNRPLSENESRSMHWANRYRRLRDWGTLTLLAVKDIDQEVLKKFVNKRIEVEVILPFARNARRDPHNYVGTNVKTIVDALVKGGLVPDDITDYIKVLEPKLVIDKTETVIIKLKTIKKEKN